MLDKEEFEHIFNLHYKSLCKYLLLFTKDFDIIEDTVQSIYVKLWEDRETISINHIKAYLFVSAKNRILSSIRNQNRRRDLLQDFLVDELIKEEADDIIDIDEFHSLVEKCVNELPPKAKNIYCLSRYDNLSYKEIASKENISVKTVENHISKALLKINSGLKSYYKKMFILFF